MDKYFFFIYNQHIKYIQNATCAYIILLDVYLYNRIYKCMLFYSIVNTNKSIENTFFIKTFINNDKKKSHSVMTGSSNEITYAKPLSSRPKLSEWFLRY